MKKIYTNEERNQVINRHLSGERIATLSASTGISRSTLYNWVEDYSKTAHHNIINIFDYNHIKQKCERLENIITILKTCGCSIDSPLSQRYAVITEMSETYNVSTLCEALNVAKGSYYNHILRNKNENTLASKRRKELTPVIEEIFNSSKQTFGAEKLQQY